MLEDKTFEKDLKKLTKEQMINQMDDLDFFKDIKYVEQNIKMPKQLNKSRGRFLLAVACFAILLLTSSVMAVFITNGTVDASKFKVEQQLVKMKNGLLGKSGQTEKIVNEDSIVMTIENIDKIEEAKKFFPDLFVPEKVPQRFVLESLTITKTSKNYFYAIYAYFDKEQNLFTICQETIPESGYSLSVTNISKEIEAKNGTIYLSENPLGDGNNAVQYLTEDYLIGLAGNIKSDEAIEILKKQAGI